MPNVLSDQLGPIDLNQMTLFEIAECAIDLCNEAGNGRLSCTGITEEYEVLVRCHFGQTVFATLLLNAQRRDQCRHLLLNGVESNQRIKFSSDVVDISARFLPTGSQVDATLAKPSLRLTDQSTDAVASLLDAARQFAQSPCHSPDRTDPQAQRIA
jgi:hypothetical protein